MISRNEAEELLQKEYYTENFLFLVSDILFNDFKSDRHEVEFNNSLFSEVIQLGESKSCDVTVYEVGLIQGKEKRRVSITQEMFRVLRGQGVNNAIVAFYNADKRNYRFSLLTSKYEFDGEKIIKVLSNPRRFSYTLGYNTKTHTAYKYLIAGGHVKNLDELISRFSVEVVNKQFYSEIANCFSELVGGEREGKKYHRQLVLHGVIDQNKYSEFAVRLIGRIVFCWFLKEKKSESGCPLMSPKFVALSEIVPNYYHTVLEPLFFELLNTKHSRRKGKYGEEEIYKQVPYLNGGLFSPHSDDLYKYDRVNECGTFGVVTIPDDWFIRLYTVLEQYNFTVDENTSYDIELSIDPEMLGRIFENLLAEINPETGENAKKSTGSFYTPRDIVDYMVDSSLLEYLKRKTNIDDIRLRALISYTKEDDDLAVFNNEEKKAIINALYTVTILDPACGSGAFPIGMLQKVVYILQEIDFDASLWFDKVTENVNILMKQEFKKKFDAGSLDYLRKLIVIQRSIFGVDIQPIAVEIARLRCFLSLIIEDNVDDSKPNRGVNPLPNLDFKFVIANSLIKLEGSDGKYQTSMFEDQNHIKKLQELRDLFFRAEDADEKNELKDEFKDIQQAMLLATISNYDKKASKLYQSLSQWKPFSNELTPWFDPEWMFGINNGFDIIIGNPPYIQLQKPVNSQQKFADLYIDCGFKTFSRPGDIYCLFYERGYELLKANGILTYITSNKWMKAGYGAKLREFFAKKTNPILLLDFAGKKVFESATVDVNILIFEKAINQGNTLSCIARENCLGNLSVFVEQNGIRMDFHSSQSWSILNPIEQSILDKIHKVGKPLKEWNIQINFGIKTGLNEAFIISQEVRDRLIQDDPKSAEIIRPILRGRDVKRYSYSFSNLWVINTHNGIREKNISRINIEDYPAIKAHLDLFYTQLCDRADQGDTPYNLRSCDYMDDFSKQKIVWKRIGSILRFCLDNHKMVCLDSTCFATGEALPYLVAILNSYMGNYLFAASPRTGTGDLIISVQAFEPIPVPKISETEQAPFIDLLNKILKAIDNQQDYTDFENELNEKVFDLYQLNGAERDWVKRQVLLLYRNE